MVKDQLKTMKQKPVIVVVGPGPTQVGGVATFIEILFSSKLLKERYTLLHLDTTRGSRGAGLASRFAIINLVYFIRQVFEFIFLAIRYRPQIIHLPVTSYWAFWKGAAFICLTRLMNIRSVAHLHGGLFDQYYRRSSRWVQRLIGYFLSQANVVVTLSERWRKFLLEEIKSDLNVVVVPNTVDPIFAQAVEKGMNSSKRERNTILFVGGLGRRKGVYDILKAVPLIMERKPDSRFVFAGTEETKGEWVKIQQSCSENNLDGEIHFLGQVTGQAKVELFLKSTIFILPSYGENMPYALLEAMTAGLPVITTPVGAIPEIIEDGRNGFMIQPGDPAILAECILQLLADPSMQASMSAANQKLIREKYMPEAAASDFDQIYHKLVEHQ